MSFPSEFVHDRAHALLGADGNLPGEHANVRNVTTSGGWSRSICLLVLAAACGDSGNSDPFGSGTSAEGSGSVSAESAGPGSADGTAGSEATGADGPDSGPHRWGFRAQVTFLFPK